MLFAGRHTEALDPHLRGFVMTLAGLQERCTEDLRGEPQACDILQITLKVLGITHVKVAHPKLHRPCSYVSGDFANDFRDAQFSARTRRLQIDIGIVALQ